MESQIDLFKRYPDLQKCSTAYFQALDVLSESFKAGGKLLVMGNGGSSADAEHFCGELVKGFTLPRKLKTDERSGYDSVDPLLANKLQNGFPAFSLGVSHALISAFANDVEWNYIFAQQIHVFAQKNDVVFGISTSGKSRNVVEGLKVAKAKGVKSIALTGQASSPCSELADITIQVPRVLTHEVQEMHLPIYHALAENLEVLFYS